MKNPISISKKACSAILQIPELQSGVFHITESINTLSMRFDEYVNSSRHKEDELLQEIKYLRKVNELYFSVLYSSGNKDGDSIRKSFLESLPAAAGNLRIYQLGNAKLLKILSEICEKNKLTYWLQSGTLLGAIRHRGFVPWDDDTDIAMFRDDIYKLRDIIKNDKKYKVTLVYDYYVKSRQIRFRTTDKNNPCFVDIYIYDYADDSSDKAWREWQTKKQEVVDYFENSKLPEVEAWRRQPLLEEGDKYSREIERLMKKQYLEPETPKTKKSKAVIWGLDNFPVKWKRLFDWDFLFPAVSLPYENNCYNAPREYLEYVKRQYGDIYSLPEDLVSHYQHIDHSDLHVENINKFLKEE